ncbi:hypothetical protein AB0K52_00990 [Glycomyces sp. NPDC049804]|uniref:hypothetical protein n=1 Tax=Glycomyces sp. NPDC049804 TaxID=3154363 RepID=UPI00344935A0
MLAGIAEFVCNRVEVAVPDRARRPERFLDQSWFLIEDLAGRRSAAFREFIVEAAPAELASRGVYIDAASLEGVQIAAERLRRTRVSRTG